MAALRGGAGLVKLAVPASIAAVVAVQHPCYMVHALSLEHAAEQVSELAVKADAIVCGPGMGTTPDVRQRVDQLLATEVPLVLDADALNVLGPWPGKGQTRRSATVWTPHPGEFSRLTGGSREDIQAARQRVAHEFALREKGVLVLKGAGTVVCDAERIFVNSTGNPGMATGGTGDVLAGLLGALLAQGFETFDAAVLAVYLHGLAGDIAASRVGEVSLLATDVLEALPEAIQRHQTGNPPAELRQ
jgi:NAD(P)H-hydrate epimerase